MTNNPTSQGLTVVTGSFSIWFWLLHGLLRILENFVAFSGPSIPSKKTGQWYYLSSFIDLPIILVIIQSLSIALWLDPCPELWSYCESLFFFLNLLLWQLSPGYLDQLYSYSVMWYSLFLEGVHSPLHNYLASTLQVAAEISTQVSLLSFLIEKSFTWSSYGN